MTLPPRHGGPRTSSGAYSSSSTAISPVVCRATTTAARWDRGWSSRQWACFRRFPGLPGLWSAAPVQLDHRAPCERLPARNCRSSRIGRQPVRAGPVSERLRAQQPMGAVEHGGQRCPVALPPGRHSQHAVGQRPCCCAPILRCAERPSLSRFTISVGRWAPAHGNANPLTGDLGETPGERPVRVLRLPSG